MARSKAAAPFIRPGGNATAESAGMVQNPSFSPGRRYGRPVLVLEDDGGNGRALEEGGGKGGGRVLRAASLDIDEAEGATTAFGRWLVWAHAGAGALVASNPLAVLLVKVLLFYGDVVTDVLSGTALLGACQTGLAIAIFVVLGLLPVALSLIDLFTPSGMGWFGALLNVTYTRMLWTLALPVFGHDAAAAERAGGNIKLFEAVFESMPQLFVQMVVLTEGLLPGGGAVVYASLMLSVLSVVQAVGGKTLDLLANAEGRGVGAVALLYLYFTADAVSRALAVAAVYGLEHGGKVVVAVAVALLVLDLAVQRCRRGPPNGLAEAAGGAVLSVFSAFPLTNAAADRDRLCAVSSVAVAAAAVIALVIGAPGGGTDDTGSGNATQLGSGSGDGSGADACAAGASDKLDLGVVAAACLCTLAVKLAAYLAGFRRLVAGAGAEVRGGLAGVFQVATEASAQAVLWLTAADWARPLSKATLHLTSVDGAPEAAWLAMAAALPQSQVTDLNLAGNKITPEVWMKIVEAIPKSKITKLNLTDCGLTEAAREKLAEAIPSSKLEVLDLCGNNDLYILDLRSDGRSAEKNSTITSEAWIKIAGAIPKSKIVNLNVGKATISLRAQCDLLQWERAQRGRKLSISSKEQLAVLLAAHKNNDVIADHTVTKLNMSLKTLTEDCVAWLCTLIQKNSHIVSLDLTECAISGAAGEKLAEAIPSSKLEVLNVSSITGFRGLPAAAAMILADVLHLTQLTDLNLSNNKRNTIGAWINIAEKLAETIPKSKLTHLNLSENGPDRLGKGGITCEAWMKIAKAIPKSQLTNLDLADCEISRDSARKLARAIPLSQLTDLNVQYCNFPVGIEAMIKAAWGDRAGLKL